MKLSDTFLCLSVIGSALWGLGFANITSSSPAPGAGQGALPASKRVNQPKLLDRCPVCLNLLRTAANTVEGFPLGSKKYCTAIKPAHTCFLAVNCTTVTEPRLHLMLQKCGYKLIKNPCDECNRLKQEGQHKAKEAGMTVGSVYYCREIFFAMACFEAKHCPVIGTLNGCRYRLDGCDVCIVIINRVLSISRIHGIKKSSFFCYSVRRADYCLSKYNCGAFPNKLTNLGKMCPALSLATTKGDSPRVALPGSVILVFLLLMAGLLAWPDF